MIPPINPSQKNYSLQPSETEDVEIKAAPKKKNRRRRRKKKTQPTSSALVHTPSPHEQLKYRFNDLFKTPLNLTIKEYELLHSLYQETFNIPGIAPAELLSMKMNTLSQEIIKDHSSFQYVEGIKVVSEQLQECNKYWIFAFNRLLQTKKNPVLSEEESKKRLQKLMKDSLPVDKEITSMILVLRIVKDSQAEKKLRRKVRTTTCINDVVNRSLNRIENIRSIRNLLIKLCSHEEAETALFCISPKHFVIKKEPLSEKKEFFSKALPYLELVHQGLKWLIDNKFLAAKQLSINSETMLRSFEEIMSNPEIEKFYLVFEEAFNTTTTTLLATNSWYHDQFFISDSKEVELSAAFEKSLRSLGNTQSKESLLETSIECYTITSKYFTLLQFFSFAYYNKYMLEFFPKRKRVNETACVANQFLRSYIENITPGSYPLIDKELKEKATSLLNDIKQVHYAIPDFLGKKITKEPIYIDEKFIPSKISAPSTQKAEAGIRVQIKRDELITTIINFTKDAPEKLTNRLKGMNKDDAHQKLKELDEQFEELMKIALPAIALVNLYNELITDSFKKEIHREKTFEEAIEFEFFNYYLPKKVINAIAKFQPLNLLDDIFEAPKKTPKMTQKKSKKQKRAERRRERQMKTANLLQSRDSAPLTYSSEQELTWLRGTKVGKIIKDLCDHGYSMFPAAGDHWKLKKEEGSQVIIPFSSKSDTLKPGTLKSVQRMVNSC